MMVAKLLCIPSRKELHEPHARTVRHYKRLHEGARALANTRRFETWHDAKTADGYLDGLSLRARGRAMTTRPHAVRPSRLWEAARLRGATYGSHAARYPLAETQCMPHSACHPHTHRASHICHGDRRETQSRDPVTAPRGARPPPLPKTGQHWSAPRPLEVLPQCAKIAVCHRLRWRHSTVL